MKDKKRIPILAGIFFTTITGAIGVSAFNALNASAADSVTPSTQQVQPKQNVQVDPTKGGHVGANGKKEELLTGDTAEKVKVAALVAVPGGTIERVETDAEGATYEAHMTKSDGSRITVKLDSNFKVTSTESGMK